MLEMMQEFRITSMARVVASKQPEG